MDSICPKCKKSITHEDYLFEVQCPCGARFNPFMGLDGGDAVSEEIPASTFNEPLAMTELEDDSFKESTNAFKEIQDFGELMPQAAEALAPKAEKLSAPRPSAPASTRTISLSHEDNFVFSSTPHLDGYDIESYLLPVSVQAEIDSTTQDPLKDAFLLLKKRAQDQGANALVEFQWKVSADGTRVFVSGLPVRVKRTSS